MIAMGDDPLPHVREAVLAPAVPSSPFLHPKFALGFATAS